LQPLAEPAHCLKGIEEDRQESADSRGPGACEAVGEGLQARRAGGVGYGEGGPCGGLCKGASAQVSRERTLIASFSNSGGVL
jgi:hypothetical protein